jgi:hypothetical protein
LNHIFFVVFVDDDEEELMSNWKILTLKLVDKDNRKLKENNQENDDKLNSMEYISNVLYDIEIEYENK